MPRRWLTMELSSAGDTPILLAEALSFLMSESLIPPDLTHESICRLRSSMLSSIYLGCSIVFYVISQITKLGKIFVCFIYLLK